MRNYMKKILLFTIVLGMLFVQTGCGKNGSCEQPKPLTKVKLILDYLPNTNHTGIYVAKDKGYYEAEGIDLEIIEPVGGISNALVATGKGEFGISYQEEVTFAKTGTEKLPIKAIATLIQHNTSGLASITEKNIKTPKDFEGKTYAGWGSPAEAAVLKAIMKSEGADFSKLNMVAIDSMGYNALSGGVDLMWLFWAWDVIPAQAAGMNLDFTLLSDYDSRLDYYTPIIVANEKVIAKKPELVKAFLRATQKGYEDAIADPDGSAEVLAKYVDTYDLHLLKKSQEYLSKKYIDDSPHWGEMKPEIWEGYMDFMKENGLIEEIVPAQMCFTNEFLPYNDSK